MNSFISSMQQDFNESFSTITIFQLSASRSDAVSRCVGLWKTKGARRTSTGMQEQFKQRGWTGTELTIGHSGRAFLTNVFFETRSYRRLLSHAPSLVPDRLKRAFLEKTFVEIIARPVPGSVTPTCELWCRVDFTSTGETTFPEDFLASMFTKIERSFRKTGILMSGPDRPMAHEVPADVPLTMPVLTTMRKAAKKSRG